MLNIAWLTNRRNGQFSWFADSLHRETGGNYDGIRVIAVDFHADEDERRVSVRAMRHCDVLHVAPKPTVWAGPHRLTKRDYFAAANARNTAICYALDGWIAFVDDLSVLMPGWLNAVRDAIKDNYIACGAYQKVKDMLVVNGELKSWTHDPAGKDYRWRIGDDKKACSCPPWCFFGCSVAAPVEVFLSIGGWPEMADGMGYEDNVTGHMLSNIGCKFRYDRRMLTFEDGPLHHVEPPMMRLDKGVSPKDKSHALNEQLRSATNSHNEFNLRVLRQMILKGGTFPVTPQPSRDWYDNQPISDL